MRNRTQHNSSPKLPDALSADPKKAIQEMMDTIDQVRNVYTRETDILEKMDMKAFLALQSEKLQTTHIYKTRVEEILARKTEMQNIDPAVKTKLRAMQSDFADLSQSNMTALKRMQKTMERLGGKIQTIAKDSVNKERAFSYGESGKLFEDNKKRVSIGVSETA